MKTDREYYDMYWDEKNNHNQTKDELDAALRRIKDLETDLAAYRLAMLIEKVK